MQDHRRALDGGTELVLEGEGAFRTSYTVIEEIGRGGSCIVYSAWYADLDGHRHSVRIKECYPYLLMLKRAEDGSLSADSSFLQAFAEAKERFRKAYAKNVEIKHTLGLINSTVDAVNIFSCHGTLYAVTDVVEGVDYRWDVDGNLQSLFIRMLALAKIIKKYHDIGVLHLDIKPENILLLPETREFVMLFDFDSLIKKEELQREGEGRFSYSDGFSAPELVQGNRKKIGEAADIYSLGAVLFFKLFGRVPDRLDGAVGTVYHFPKDLREKFQDERYQPELFAALCVFLHKTVASAVACRYPHMDMAISALEELIRRSDIDGVFLFHQFSYHFSGFVGRERELARMEECFLGGQQVLFLSGIGGIGKTELARRYAFVHRGKYRKIVFLPFHGSVRETVCSSELRIHKLEQGEDEDNDDYYRRKLNVLKMVVSAEDLMILDNFDVDFDEDLEELFACPCRFLVTSREDFRDFGYEQLDVESLAEMEELLGLFKVYHPQVEDEEAVAAIIELIDRHTMTLALIAKYLRITAGDPGEFLQMLMQKEGITSTEEIGIKHRKDKKLRAESMNRHLLALFDLSGFSAIQGELMRSLSLLGSVRISREMFLACCPVEHGGEELQVLVQRGWVEYDEGRDKLSLHQIILDLVYHYLQPTAENCPHIVRGMGAYVRRDLPNHAERMVRRQLATDFMERMQGQTLDYAGLCVDYCQKIRKRKEYLDIAERICLGDGGGADKENVPVNGDCLDKGVCLDKGGCLDKADRRKEGKDIENKFQGNDLLQKICRMKLEIAASGDDWFDKVQEAGDSFCDEDYLAQKAEEIVEEAERARHFAGMFGSSPDYLGRFCVDLACELDGVAAGSSVFMGIEEDNVFLDAILDRAVALFDEAESYLLQAEMENEEKIKYLKKMQKFYGEDDFVAIYRCEHYADADKTWHYQKLINGLRRAEDRRIYVSDIRLDNLAEIAERKGDYRRALEIHQEMGEKGEEAISTQDNLYEIGRLYREMGEKEKAISCFERVLELEKESWGKNWTEGEKESREKNWIEGEKGSRENGWEQKWNIGFFSYVCGQLVDLLLGEQQTEKARRYSRDLVCVHQREMSVEGNYRENRWHICEEGNWENKDGIGDEDDVDHLQWLTLGYYWLYKIEQDGERKQEYWECAEKYFSGISEKLELSKDFLGFLLEFADRQECAEDKIKKAFGGMERVKTWYNWEITGTFLDYILEICEKEIGEREVCAEEFCFKRYQVMAYIRYSECLMSKTSADEAQILDYAIKARTLYEESGMEDEYLYSLIYKTLGEFYGYHALDGERAEENKRKCDYFLLAEYDAAGKEEKQQIELWKEAAREYHSLDNYRMENACYQRLFKVLTPAFCRKNHERFDDYWYPSIEQIRCYQNLQNGEKVREKGWELCKRALEECIGREDEEDREKICTGGMKEEKERESAGWLGNKLKECAELFLNVGWEKDAFVLYILALVSMVQEKISWKLWNRYSYAPDKERDGKEEDNKIEELLSIVFEVFHGDICSRDVDIILDVGEKLLLILKKNGNPKVFAEEWLCFKTRYQHKDVEFKRKR